jgi:hypothetical protein
MRIYEGDYTVGSILEDCGIAHRESAMSTRARGCGVDLYRLARRLKNMPVEEIRKRRLRLNLFYEEVLVSADPVRGVSFTSCLMILAHHKIITDSKSLR